MTGRNYCIECIDEPGNIMFDRLLHGDRYAVTHHECNVYEFTASGGGTPSDDFFEESEPYVCTNKEYAPRKLTLREKILFGA